MSKYLQHFYRCLLIALLGLASQISALGAVNVLMVTANSGSLTAFEAGRKAQVESWGFTVNTIWAGDSQATFDAAFANNRAVFLPDEAAEASVGYKLRQTTLGVVSEHPGLADELGFCSSTASTVTSSTVYVSNNSHYVTSVFATGNLTLGSGTYNVTRMGGVTAPGAVVLATVGSDNSIVAIEAGSVLANTYNSSNIAAGRRVQFPLPVSANDGSTFNSNTFTLANRMLWWAAGLDRALIVKWKLDETSGTTAADSSGNGITGTYTGGPTLGVASPRRFGTYFTADSRYVISAPNNMLLNSLGVGNADFSVAFWVKPNTPPGGWRPLLHKGGADFDRSPGVWLNPGSNRVHFRVGTTNNNNEGTDSAIDLPTGVWAHVACVKAGNKWRCYINGVLDTELTLSGNTIGNTGPLYVGDDPWYPGSMASIDDVRVYTGALTDAEVKNLYGVVGHWKLDETSGTTAADSSPAVNNGVYTNGPALNQSGVRGAATNFDGTDDYIGVADSQSLKATDAVTMAAWIRPTPSANVDRIIVNKEGEYEVAISDTNEIKWAIANTSPGWAWHQTGKFVPNGSWSHVVVSYDGVEVKTYLNGVLVETYAASGSIGDVYPAMQELRIGGRTNSPAGKYFAGTIDDVYVYTREVSAAEVANMYGLIGYWKFAEGSGTTAADSSGNANPATLSGGAAWETNCAGDVALQTNGAGGIAQTNAAFQPPSEGTVAFWMRGAGMPAGTARLMGLGGDWEIRQLPNGTLSFDLGASPYTGNEPFSTLDPVATAGKWYHIAAVFNDVDNSYSVYINGQLRTSGISPVDLVPQVSGILSFGTRTGTSEYWPGALRDVRVYNRGLAAGEIAQLYGLIGYWKLDESSGSLAADSSGFGRDGTVFGTPSWPTGAVNNSLQVNSSTYMEVPSLLDSPKNVTLAAWGNLTGTDSSGSELVSIGDYLAIRLDEGGSTKMFYYNGSSWDFVTVGQTFLNRGWHHFAAVFNDDANVARFYIDGTEVASATTAVTISYTGQGTKLVVGRHGNNKTGWNFTGRVDEVRVYSRALCPSEIQEIKGSSFGGIKVIKWIEIQ
jgi:concanavalin A-like lectin/glucanase superfamily protein